jgi:hypothetical protein
MRPNLKHFLFVLAICAAVSIVLAAFNGRTLASLIDLGSYVGAASSALGAWRMYSSNDALNQAQEMQSLQNLNAIRSGQEAPHQQFVGQALSTGPLFFAGLTWLVLLQSVRYGFGISL